MSRPTLFACLGWLAALTLIFALDTAAIAASVQYTKQSSVVKGRTINLYTKPTASGGALRIRSFKGALWFIEHDKSTIVRFSPNGRGDFFKVPGGGSPLALTGAPDGNIWFTQFSKGNIGRMTPAGKFTLFPTGLAENKSNDIVVGPGNTLFFPTDFNGIGRTTLGGATSFFPIRANADQPTALARGPKNTIWFIEWAGRDVGRLTPSTGALATVRIAPKPFTNSFGIALGPDGRIWFCDPQRKRIGAVKTDLTGLTFYKAGITGQPAGIVAGPDGKLYFGEYEGRIGSITTAGKVTEYAIPGATTATPFPVIGVTVGPDRNIWFVSNASSKVGQLVLPK